MPYFRYRQNNSGGVFTRPAIHVFVEADTAAEADALAQGHGIYFDGCETGDDCECCGDRWSRAWEEGQDEPRVYGEPVIKYLASDYVGMWAEPKRGIHEVMIVYKTGDVEFMDVEGK